MNRRKFIQHTALVAAGAATLNFTADAKVNWPVGCFNRPWTKWSFDETLKQIKAAGYKSTGLLSRTKDEPFIGANATPEYLGNLKKRIAENGLVANMGALRSRHNVPLEDSIKEVRTQIDNAKFLSLEYALSFGADNPAEFAHYYKVMNDAAAYAQDKGVKLVMKPHGGISGSSEEILRVIKEVDHKNFSIWYDAGNIIHYTGKDPVAEIEPIARHITGFCAKDCGELKGDVMLQFGEGKVDFAAVFKKLEAGGFDGPVMVECCKIGATPEETTANARANREFLEKVLASI
ncbi:MAG TPA: sugar phosphate isomerase/epimerase family protein [Blastocatellia bacterium]|jgi:sugar phosphate isomerase/epimerase|nr:sugar phosphate isomerase/epimerase family protein [Blastocatellia bacterium]